MAFLQAGDTISGREGTAFVTIDGQNFAMFELKNITATVELAKTEVNTLGKRTTQQKVTGASGTGSMTIHKVTSRYAKIGIDYIKSGRVPNITIKITNNDPQSTIGRQTTLLKNVIFDSVIIASLDVDAEILEEDADFTFDDAELLEAFKQPTLG
ncbi:phage tail tube protein [Aerococcus urinaeequi]|uniref:phage tail tube protein n=1 Tax=Aerococcus urinaeequi TaxID=51665 RepID=UPI003D6B3A87